MSGNNHNNKSLGSGEWAAAGGGGGGANTNTTPRKSTAYNANRRRSTARKSKAAHRKESVLRSSVLSGGLAGAGTSSASNVLVDWVTRRTRIFKRAKPEDPDEAARGYVTQAQEAPKKVSSVHAGKRERKEMEKVSQVALLLETIGENEQTPFTWPIMLILLSPSILPDPPHPSNLSNPSNSSLFRLVLWRCLRTLPVRKNG